MVFTLRIVFSLLLLSALPALADTPPAKPDPEVEELSKLISGGFMLMQQGKLAEAMSQDFDPAVAKADAKVAAEPRKIYTARTLPEVTLYMVMAAGEKKEAVALPEVWSQAYFFKGFVLNGMGDLAGARTYLQRAVDMAPMNAQYLSEMGNLESKEKHWDEALKIYLKDEEAANVYSPPNMKSADLGRALRGQGFVYVELNRLDEAEAAYRKCLTINANDQRAAAELQYVQIQKTKQSAMAAVSQTKVPTIGDAIFLFGRANYFRALTKHRNCQAFNAAMLASIDERLEKARVKLAAQYGEQTFPTGKSVTENISDGVCDAMALNSYSTHVQEVEALLPAN